MILPAVAGFLIVAIILWEAFETIILPRRVTRRFRLTRLYFRSTWFPWRSIAHRIRSNKQRETFLSFYGPLSLLCLFGLWATMLILGFGLVYFNNSRIDQTHPTLETCFYLSGTTFFTLGQYSNLVTETSPGNWSPIAAQPDPGLPADGFYDVLALDSGLASGGSQSGFSVQFTYLGSGTPGSQLFNFVDSSSFATLFAGQTTLSSGGSGGSGPTSVPEIDPSALVSAMTLLLGALAVMRGRRPSRELAR